LGQRQPIDLCYASSSFLFFNKKLPAMCAAVKRTISQVQSLV